MAIPPLPPFFALDEAAAFKQSERIYAAFLAGSLGNQKAYFTSLNEDNQKIVKKAIAILQNHRNLLQEDAFVRYRGAKQMIDVIHQLRGNEQNVFFSKSSLAYHLGEYEKALHPYRVKILSFLSYLWPKWIFQFFSYKETRVPEIDSGLEIAKENFLDLLPDDKGQTMQALASVTNLFAHMDSESAMRLVSRFMGLGALAKHKLACILEKQDLLSRLPDSATKERFLKAFYHLPLKKIEPLLKWLTPYSHPSIFRSEATLRSLFGKPFSLANKEKQITILNLVHDIGVLLEGIVKRTHILYDCIHLLSEEASSSNLYALEECIKGILASNSPETHKRNFFQRLSLMPSCLRSDLITSIYSSAFQLFLDERSMAKVFTEKLDAFYAVFDPLLESSTPNRRLLAELVSCNIPWTEQRKRLGRLFESLLAQRIWENFLNVLDEACDRRIQQQLLTLLENYPEVHKRKILLAAAPFFCTLVYEKKQSWIDQILHQDPALLSNHPLMEALLQNEALADHLYNQTDFFSPLIEAKGGYEKLSHEEKLDLLSFLPPSEIRALIVNTPKTEGISLANSCFDDSGRFFKSRVPLYPLALYAHHYRPSLPCLNSLQFAVVVPQYPYQWIIQQFDQQGMNYGSKCLQAATLEQKVAFLRDFERGNLNSVFRKQGIFNARANPTCSNLLVSAFLKNESDKTFIQKVNELFGIEKEEVFPDHIEIPEDFMCPISRCLMGNPYVVYSKGPNGTVIERIYDKPLLDQWFSDKRPPHCDPLTSYPIFNMKPATVLETRITKWKQDHLLPTN